MEKQPQPTIAELNDEFRRTTHHDVFITHGVEALEGVPLIIFAVKLFNDFNPDNDPYGEHDFGAIDWHGTKTCWKIDYYDPGLQQWHDPLSPDCRRILTVMLAEE